MEPTKTGMEWEFDPVNGLQGGCGALPRRIQEGETQYNPFANSAKVLTAPAPPKIRVIPMFSGHNPFNNGDILILSGKSWIVTGFTGSSSSPITDVQLKEVT